MPIDAIVLTSTPTAGPRADKRHGDSRCYAMRYNGFSVIPPTEGEEADRARGRWELTRQFGPAPCSPQDRYVQS